MSSTAVKEERGFLLKKGVADSTNQFLLAGD